MWYYKQEEDNFKESAKTVLLMLLFPKGENDWHTRIPICGAQLKERGENARQREGKERAHSQCVSDTCYYAYHLHVRKGDEVCFIKFIYLS